MLDINTLRNKDLKILCIGSYRAIIQSILDYDFMLGKKHPSICAVVASGRRYERYFFGKKEILLPVYSALDQVPTELKQKISLFLNLSSGRRVLNSSEVAVRYLPNLLGGAVFAEDTPEMHAIELKHVAIVNNKFIAGPASVGILIPGFLKIGAIGGVDARQIIASKLLTQGNVAVFSASGGMTNEILRVVTSLGKRVSFSLAFGGDRFPMISPSNAFMAAQNDENTEDIVYFGELGGTDEYELAKLLKSGQITKKVICYIAGTISDIFPTPPQFGHAKAMAKSQNEGALAKREVLRSAGAMVANSFTEFVEMIKNIPSQQQNEVYNVLMDDLQNRRHALISSSISRDQNGEPTILGKDLLELSRNRSFAYIVTSMFLGREIKSDELEEFVDFVLKILVDHGPYVSGAVNTIITSRAGRDLVSSLSAGLLTIGPRFGGAINQAAANWIDGVEKNINSSEFVENFAAKKQYIAGIGHRKYRIDLPDPRVGELLKFTDSLTEKRYTQFAKSVEQITTSKKGNLILNVDGAIAAVMMDIMSEKEGVSVEGLKKLTDTEFFNSLFVLSRSVGFIAHFLDQKRLDEGLFRLPEDEVAEAEI